MDFHGTSRTDTPEGTGKRRRISLVISDLSCGGAQRVMTYLAGHWAAAGHQVSLITLSDGKDDFFTLPSAIQRIGLGVTGRSRGLGSALFNNLHRVRTLRRAFRETDPDVVVAFGDRTNVLTLAASRGMHIPVYVSERSDPRLQELGWPWPGLRRRLYPGARGVIVLTERIRTWAADFVPPSRLHVVPNPIDKPAAAFGTRSPALPSLFVASLGRLSPEKRFHHLIRAFHACNRPGWTLVIFGEGPERKRLEREARMLGITDRVLLPGPVDVPQSVLRHASLFVLCSEREGFPNALGEAMAVGVPVISVDYPAGPSEIIRHGIDGLIVEQADIPALTTAMTRLMDNPDLRRELGQNAERVCERFSSNRVMGLWDGLLEYKTAS